MPLARIPLVAHSPPPSPPCQPTDTAESQGQYSQPAITVKHLPSVVDSRGLFRKATSTASSTNTTTTKYNNPGPKPQSLKVSLKLPCFPFQIATTTTISSSSRNSSSNPTITATTPTTTPTSTPIPFTTPTFISASPYTNTGLFAVGLELEHTGDITPSSTDTASRLAKPSFANAASRLAIPSSTNAIDHRGTSIKCNCRLQPLRLKECVHSIQHCTPVV